MGLIWFQYVKHAVVHVMLICGLYCANRGSVLCAIVMVKAFRDTKGTFRDAFIDVIGTLMVYAHETGVDF